MVTTFVIGDTHLGQSSVLTFKRSDGTPLRAFASIEEHDEYIVEQWNKTVRPQDKVYHLGDVVMHKRCLPILSRLNGHKRLVMGNHDTHGVKEYLEYFDELYGCRIMDGIILTHIPIHADSVDRFKVNVHGHLHANLINDRRYLNVSCEQINYTPISLEEIREKVERRFNPDWTVHPDNVRQEFLDTGKDIDPVMYKKLWDRYERDIKEGKKEV